ncbi:MAG: hypothetical protein AAF151_26490 [Cyanobacteria bacterium J06656_5]
MEAQAIQGLVTDSDGPYVLSIPEVGVSWCWCCFEGEEICEDSPYSDCAAIARFK